MSKISLLWFKFVFLSLSIIALVLFVNRMTALPDTSNVIASCRDIELVQVLDGSFSFKVVVDNETRFFIYARQDEKMVLSFLEDFIQNKAGKSTVDLILDETDSQQSLVLQILVDGKSIGDIDEYQRRKAISLAFLSLFSLTCFFVLSFKYGVKS